MFNLVRQLFGGPRAESKRHAPASNKVAPARGLPPRTIATTRRPAADLLDNPGLKLDTGQDEGFDPYNTGTFNRSGSWERITKQRKG